MRRIYFIPILFILFNFILMANPANAGKLVINNITVTEKQEKDGSFTLLFEFSTPEFKENIVFDYAVLSFSAEIIQSSNSKESDEIVLEALDDSETLDSPYNLNPVTGSIDRKTVGKKTVKIDITEIVALNKKFGKTNHKVHVVSHRSISGTSLNNKTVDSKAGYDPISFVIFYTEVEQENKWGK